MDKTLSDKLNEDFPELYKKFHKYSMYGFECGDGWFQLLYDLSEDLTAISREKGYECPIVVQVKEKFGGLRFYVDRSHDDYQTMIQKAELLSEKTCEICGEKGTRRPGGWIQTLCDKHSINKT